MVLSILVALGAMGVLRRRTRRRREELIREERAIFREGEWTSVSAKSVFGLAKRGERN